jgi:hypothetical protein
LETEDEKPVRNGRIDLALVFIMLIIINGSTSAGAPDAANSAPLLGMSQIPLSNLMDFATRLAEPTTSRLSYVVAL